MSKIQLQDFVEYGRLFEVYKGFLSEDRQKIMTSYFEYNMTLVEIAKEKGISRQGVLDSIQKSCEKLKDCEKTLHLLEKKCNLRKKLEDLKNIAEKCSQIEIKEKVVELLEEI